MIIIHGLTNSGKDTTYKLITERFPNYKFKNIKISSVGKQLIIDSFPMEGLTLETFDQYKNKKIVGDSNGKTYGDLAVSSSVIRNIHKDIPITYATKDIHIHSESLVDNEYIPVFTDLRYLSELEFLRYHCLDEQIFFISLADGIQLATDIEFNEVKSFVINDTNITTYKIGKTRHYYSFSTNMTLYLEGDLGDYLQQYISDVYQR